MRYDPGDGRWRSRDTPGLAAARDAFSRPDYEASKLALKLVLCDYFSGDCKPSHGTMINLLGATPAGGKCLKVRWALPGAGKRGGLRLSVVVYCGKRKVVIADAFNRKDDPSAEEFSASVAGLD